MFKTFLAAIFFSLFSLPALAVSAELDYTMSLAEKELRSRLPMRVDEMTQLSNAIWIRSTHTFSYTYWVDDTRASVLSRKERMASYLRGSICTDPFRRYALDNGVTISHNYYEVSGTHIMGINVNKATCLQHRLTPSPQ
jgi:hypothetical protein